MRISGSGSVVGARALRAKLSAHLRTVARGQTVTISDRRRQPVARLVPIERTPEDDVLDRLAAEGVIQRGAGKPGSQPPVRTKRKGRLVSEMVVEGRR
jgi:prevent-host-death family protein